MGIVRKALYLATIGWPARIVMAAILALASPVIFIIAMISIVGIPIAFIFAAVPAVAATYVLSELLYRFVFKRVMTPSTAILSSIGVVLLAAAIVASLANGALDLKAASLTAHDKDALTSTPIRVLGLAESGGYFDRYDSACNAVCLRLLLNKSVNEVLVARIKDGDGALSPATPALGYRFVRRGGCIDKSFSDADEPIDFNNGEKEALTPAQTARLRIAAGECLIERKTTLGQADAIIATETVSRGKSAFSAGLDVFADTVSAERLTFLRRANAGFEEEYRRTKILVLRHPPLATPGINGGAELRTELGFYRIARRINRDKYEYGKSDRARFIAERLGLAYALRGEAPDQRAIVDAIIASGDAASETKRDAIDDFIRAATRSLNSLSRKDAERILRIFEKKSIELPTAASSGAAAIGRLHADLAPRVADALFARIKNAEPDARTSKYNYNLVRMASKAISTLPDAALEGRKEQIMALARDPARRRNAAHLYSRLSTFGREGTRDLFSIIDIALAERAADLDERGWMDLYVESLTGLCRIGDPATPDLLIARLNQAPDLKTFRQDFVIKTLIRSGMPSEKVRGYYARGADEEALKSLDQDIRNAGRNDRCD